MKKLIFTLLCIVSTSVLAQETFNRHNIIATGGIGGCIGYNYQNYSNDAFNYSNVDNGFYLGYNIGYTLPITLEYALSDKFGIGASFSQNSYVNIFSSKTKNTNFGAFGAFHFARKRKIEMYVRLNVGVSSGVLNVPNDGYYSYNYNNNSYYYVYTDYYKASMKGWFAKPSYGFRLYFTKNIGMFTDVGVGVYSLHSNTIELNDYKVDLSNGDKVRLVMVGVEVSTGLAVKF